MARDAIVDPGASVVGKVAGQDVGGDVGQPTRSYPEGSREFGGQVALSDTERSEQNRELHREDNTLIGVRLLPEVITRHRRASVTVNGTHYSFSSDAVTEAPVYVVEQLKHPVEVVTAAEVIAARNVRVDAKREAEVQAEAARRKSLLRSAAEIKADAEAKAAADALASDQLRRRTGELGSRVVDSRQVGVGTQGVGAVGSLNTTESPFRRNE